MANDITAEDLNTGDITESDLGSSGDITAEDLHQLDPNTASLQPVFSVSGAPADFQVPDKLREYQTLSSALEAREQFARENDRGDLIPGITAQRKQLAKDYGVSLVGEQPEPIARKTGTTALGKLGSAAYNLGAGAIESLRDPSSLAMMAMGPEIAGPVFGLQALGAIPGQAVRGTKAALSGDSQKMLEEYGGLALGSLIAKGTLKGKAMAPEAEPPLGTLKPGMVRIFEADGRKAITAEDVTSPPKFEDTLPAEPTPTEVQNAPTEKPVEASVPEQPQGGDQGGQAAEAGVGDSVLSPAAEQPQPQGEVAPAVVAPIEETPPQIGIRNAVTGQVREAMGLPERVTPEKVGEEQQLNEAQAVIAQDPGRGTRLVDELGQNPRPLNYLDDGVLTYELAARVTEHKAAMSALDAADTPEAKSEAETRLANARDRVADAIQVAESVGTENARGLEARKRLVSQQYELPIVEARAKAAKVDEPLSPRELSKYKAHADELEKLAEQIRKVEQDKAISTARDVFGQMLSDHAKTVREARASSGGIVGFLDQKAEAARQRIRDRLTGVKSTATDPVTAALAHLADEAIIGASHLAHGIRDLGEWTKKMIAEFGEGIRPQLPQIWGMANDYHDSTEAVFTPKRRGKTPDIRNATAEAKAAADAGEALTKKTVYDLARGHVKDGMTGLDEVMEAVRKDLEPSFPGITVREVRDTFSDYGKTKLPDPAADLKTMRDMRAQSQKISALEDVAQKIAPKRSGMQRDKPSDVVRELTRKLNEAMKAAGIEVVSPEQQLKTSLEGVKTRLKNQLTDLDTEIAQLEKGIVETKKKTGIKYDEDANRLKAERDKKAAVRDSLREALVGTEERKGMTPEQRERNSLAAAKRSLEEYQRRVREKEFASIKKPVREASDAVKKARAERDAAKEEFEQLQENSDIAQKERIEAEKAALEEHNTELERKLAIGDIQPEKSPVNRPDTVAELEILKQKRDALNREMQKRRSEAAKGTPEEQEARDLARKIEALDKVIAGKESKIASGDVGAKPGQVNRPLRPEIERRRQRIQQLDKQLSDMRKAGRARRSPEEVALSRAKKAVERSIMEGERKLAESDFSVRPRPVTPVDAELAALKVKQQRVRDAIDRAIEERRLKGRTKGQKAGDFFVKLERAMKLSGPAVLGKLTAAAATRLGTTRVEGLLQRGLSKLPVLSRIAAKAPSQAGLRVSSAAKAYAATVTNGLMDGIRQMGKVLKTGQSDLDVRFGKRRLAPENPYVEAFGRMHAALKNPVKYDAFKLSLQQRIEHGIRNGVDVSNPAVHLQMMKDAYIDANRSIFMQDNWMSNAYQVGVGYLRKGAGFKEGASGFTTAQNFGRGLDFLLPIVKVPTNIAFETASHGLGLLSGTFKVAKALKNGIENLEPHQADDIMRHLTKGSIGAGLILLGYYHADNIGGYYQEGEKRRPNEPRASGFRLFGENMPRWMFHAPVFEALQIGATIRRVSDHIVKSTGRAKGLEAGVGAAAMGLLKEVPFMDEVHRVGAALGTDAERGYYLGELAKSTTVPAISQQAASYFDTHDSEGNPVPRKPKTIWEHVKMGIPGLRETVPRKW